MNLKSNDQFRFFLRIHSHIHVTLQVCKVLWESYEGEVNLNLDLKIKITGEEFSKGQKLVIILILKVFS